MLFTNCFLNAVYLALDDIINVFSAHICFVCKGQKVKFLIFHMKERIITCVFKKNCRANAEYVQYGNYFNFVFKLFI